MRSTTLSIGCALLLGACTQQSSLAPEEVLRRAAEASRTLTSVAFVAEGTLVGEAPMGQQGDLTVDATGWIRPESKQVQISAEVGGELDVSDIELAADIIVAGEEETYLNLKTISSADPASP